MLFQHDAKMILSMIVSVVGTPVVDSLHAEKTYKKKSLKRPVWLDASLASSDLHKEK